MDVKFEVRCKSSDRMFYDYVRKITYRKTTFVRLGIYLFFLLCMALNLSRSSKAIAVVTGTWAVLGIVIIFTEPKRMVRRLKESELRFHKGENLEGVVRFDDDDISFEKGTHSFRLEYPQIGKIYFMKRTCVLIVDRSVGILMSTDGFTIGDYERFQSYIQIKCYNAICKRR